MRTLRTLGFLFLIVSCTYAPNEKYVSPIKPKAPTSSISLNNYNNKDSIYIYQPTDFQFNVSATNVTIKSIDVILAGTTLLSTTQQSGSFSIYGPYLTTGVYQLKVQFTSNSGTGSLADVTGNEQVSIWRTWVLVIDVSPPTKPVLQKSVENGFLKISWPPFKKPNFTAYYIQKVNYYENKYVLIKNPLQSYFIDSAYVGSNGYSTSYYVTTYTVMANNTSDAKVVNDPQSFNLTYNSADSTAQLSWRKSNYPGAFKNAVITESGTVRNTITNATDTTLTLKLNQVLFGATSNVSFTINSKYPPQYGYVPFTKTVTITNPAGLKKLYGSYQTYYYNQVLGGIMSRNAGSAWLRLYNASMQPVDSINMSGISSFSMPYPGHYMYYPQAGGITKLDLLTKSTSSILTKGQWGSSYITPGFVSGSDNQLASYGLFNTLESPDLEYRTGLADMNADTIMSYSDAYVAYNPNQTYSFNNRRLSDDGQYAAWGSTIYSVTNGAFTSIGSVSGSFMFRPDNCNEIISLGSSTLILSTLTQTLLRNVSPPFPGLTFRNYDPVTKNILYEGVITGGAKLFLVNIDTGGLTTLTVGETGTVFYNGYLIDAAGYYLKLM